MKIAIISGAPQPWLDLEEIRSSFVIGVDYGALTAVNQGLHLNLAIGDFDSVTDLEFEVIKQASSEIIKLSPQKNETDTEVALNVALAKQATEVVIYGALGGRIDHSLANIRLLLQFIKKGISITLVNQKNILTILSPGQHEIKQPRLPYISFFAVESTVENLTLTGLKYPLKNYTLTQENIRCISNEIVDSSFNVSFSSGYLLMIYSCD